MKELNELRLDRFSRSPAEEGPTSRQFAWTEVASGQRAPAKFAVVPVNIGRRGQLAARIAAGSLGVLLLALAMLATPVESSAQFSMGVSISFGPPALPVYEQPPCPAPGYIFTPGYWAWDPNYGYFWVPGTWVPAPSPGLLWTPGYWAWDEGNGAFFWNAGYWGPRVGFYGGVAYGFGYTGRGYEGGYWNGRQFYYNRTVNNVSTTNVTNVYNKTVINNVNVTNVSYNGGSGGVTARPTGEELEAARQRRAGPVGEQRQHELTARAEPSLRASVNQGRPSIAATPRPAVFNGRGVVMARSAGAPYRPAPAMGNAGHPAPGRNFNPARTEESRQAAPSERGGPPAQAERQAPFRGERAQPNREAEREPMARQPEPRAATQRAEQPRPQENRKQEREEKKDKKEKKEKPEKWR
jgi:YXWGXW repeat-containing protein